MRVQRVTEDERITGVILAGGQGRRMGTIDKGLVSIDGRPMVAHVLGRLRPQVDEILINANQHRVEYEAFGYPVLAASPVLWRGCRSRSPTRRSRGSRRCPATRRFCRRI